MRAACVRWLGIRAHKVISVLDGHCCWHGKKAAKDPASAVESAAAEEQRSKQMFAAASFKEAGMSRNGQE
jgi:hypothetical protein